jgi:hypothetical protein
MLSTAAAFLSGITRIREAAVESMPPDERHYFSYKQ